MFAPTLLLLLAAAGLIEGRSLHEFRHAREPRHLHGGLMHLQRRQANADSLTLAQNAIQEGSFNNGRLETGGAEVGQADSAISKNNFINFCAGKTLTNGFQHTTGSCNGIVMGDIPAKTQMVSSIITFPLSGSKDIQSDTTFNISVQTSNLVAGSFTNAAATYYAGPQQLQGGKVVGHTHVTVQDMGASLNPTTPLDPTKFAFFKGINDAGNGQGLLQAVVTGGLPAGNYRVCTMTSSSNHQPVLMPVAQRGTPDDCTKFTVIGNGKTKNDAANDGVKGLAAAALAAQAIALGPNKNTVAGSAAATATSDVASTTKGGNGKADTTSSVDAKTTAKGNGGKGGGKDASASVPPFQNTTSVAATTTKAAASTSVNIGKGNNNNGGGKGGNTKNAVSTTATAISDVATTKAAATQTVSTVIIRKVIVIETFFVFKLSLGGLPPAVGKKGNKFVVKEKIFEEITLACAAACEEQFTTCISFSGPGFSFEECTTQKQSCGSAASTASSSAAPATVTATVQVPQSATVTGSVLAETTISTTYVTTAAPTKAAVVTSAAEAVVTSPAEVVATGVAESLCSITTSTVFVDEPAATAVASESLCSLTTSTVFVDAPVATGIASAPASAVASASPSAAPVSNAAALGGIAAPAITDSGNKDRPFLVNGNTFVEKAAAIQRSCDVQFNQCANAVNGGKATGFKVSDCQTQKDACPGKTT